MFIKYLHLTCLIGISLHIQIYPAKYNHISPNEADFLLGLLLIQFLRVICAVSCHKNGSLATALTWLDKNRRKHNPEERTFSPCFTRLRKNLLLSVIFEGKNAGVFNNIYETFKKQPPCYEEHEKSAHLFSEADAFGEYSVFTLSAESIAR